MTSFVLPIEAETCAIPDGDDAVFFGGSDKKLYTFPASDIPSTPKVSVAGETEEKIVGAAVYQSSMKDYYYLIASEEAISVYSKKFENVGTIEIEGGNGFELSDIAIYQGEDKSAKDGLIAYAFENKDYGKVRKWKSVWLGTRPQLNTPHSDSEGSSKSTDYDNRASASVHCRQSSLL